MNKYLYLLRFFLLFSVFLIFSIKTVAQTQRAKGLVFDASRYKKEAKKRGTYQRNGSLIPIKVSLRSFCPTPQDQGTEPSCTAWATAYAAMTIQKAIQRKLNNREDVDKIACSKSFVFNQLIEKNKKRTPSVEETFGFLSSHGTCLAATFRNDEPITKMPDELAIDEAQNYRLLGAKEVFDPDSTISPFKQIQRLKDLLADSVPVVVGLRLPYSFSNLTNGQFIYDKKEPIDSSAHALCLVGYDNIDSTFELMNSWGTTWGDAGFVRLSYKDLMALMCCAYRLTPQFLLENDAPILRGGIVLRRILGYNDLKIPQFGEVRVQYDNLNKYYSTLQPHWAIGTGFQLAIRQMPPNWWVYVFGINKEAHVSMLHNSSISSESVEKIVPDDNIQYVLEAEGTEWLCIVCTKDPLSNVQELLKKSLKSNPEAIQTQVYQCFKDFMTDEIKANTKRMGFVLSPKTAVKGAIMLLKLETQ